MQRCPYIHEMRERFFNEQPTTQQQQQPPISYKPFQPKPIQSVQSKQPLPTLIQNSLPSLPPSHSQVKTTATGTTMPIRGVDRESEREGLIDVRQSSALSGASSNQVGTVVKVGAILASGSTKKKNNCNEESSIDGY